uniref:Uncharacterized protein n=1 Tax=Physcomitrium patens TaxID=3218 RepID=A0A2K1IGS7_PHYPA|nr:hypothetical protein PHYPA_029074 [Physcomitrium patens]
MHHKMLFVEAQAARRKLVADRQSKLQVRECSYLTCGVAVIIDTVGDSVYS